jgi:hypothetical protein
MSCGVVSSELSQILLHHKIVDELGALGGEWEMVFIFELFDDEARHFRLGEGLIGQNTGIL